MNIKNAVTTNFLLLIFIFIAGISNSQTTGNFKLVSPAFQEGKPIPAKYTCDSTNVSPALSWSGFPAKTKSFALIMDDPDAPMDNWVHWVMYNISATVTGIEEKVIAAMINAADGINSWGNKGYNGPCPPDGTHRYIFTLYALDKTLNPKEGMTKYALQEEMKSHILGETTLTGLFRVE